MKKYISAFIIFLVVFIVYFAVGTNYTFKPKWALDYFNPLAQSLLHFRLNIENLGTTYDLSYYEGKWYGPWGIIPAILLIPIQLFKGRFVPPFYVSIFFSSLNVSIMYLLLKRMKNDFLPQLSVVNIYMILVLFAFGTTQFYVGTLGSVWHVDQITTSFISTLGIYFIFRKDRKLIHYFLSILCFSITLLGRPTVVLLNILPVSFYLYDLFIKSKIVTYKIKKTTLFKEVFLLSVPFLFFSTLFFIYNYARFGNVLEYGFNYIHESPYLASLREQHGPFSFNNMLQNLWYMLFEIPGLSYADKIVLNINLKGNSVFFLTMPLLTAFLASPMIRKGKKISLNPYIAFLWFAAIITIIPSLMHYGSGWMQFGYRYILDINVLLVLLSVLGIKGKVNILYFLGIIFSIFLYYLGINILM